jgi:protein-disulfide isomerase
MTRFHRLAPAALAVLILAAPARAEMSAEEKAEIGTVIREYLLANPEVLEEAIDVLQKRKEAAQAAAQQKAITEKADTIFASEHQMVLGNPQGAVTMVEFFDYNCGYCKRAVPDMTALIAANPDLKIVLKEFPILSEGSAQAARVSVAVKDIAPERYLDFHQALCREGKRFGKHYRSARARERTRHFRYAVLRHRLRACARRRWI